MNSKGHIPGTKLTQHYRRLKLPENLGHWLVQLYIRLNLNQDQKPKTKRAHTW